MPVKITKGVAPPPSLTSPPTQPNPHPPIHLIAEKLHYADRTIIVTVPFPDTVEIVADVLNEHLMNPDATGGSAKSIYKKMDGELQDLVQSIQKGETLLPAKWPIRTGKNAKVSFLVEYDEAQPLHRATLTLWRVDGPDFGRWRVKYEFSASKTGPTGLVKLTAAFEEALPFKFNAMLPAFKVARVDPAIDLIGAYPLDLIAHVGKPGKPAGKRMVYVGDNGRPESVYLYDRKKPLTEPPSSMSYNTRGALRLKLYERRDYMKQFMLPPPYGDCPVTRVEVQRRWSSGRPYLATLDKIPNPLTNRRVAYAAGLAGQTNKPNDWLVFCLAAFGGGVGTTQGKWQSIARGVEYWSRYKACTGDLVHSERWEGWAAGLAATGLDAWIKGAQEP